MVTYGSIYQRLRKNKNITLQNVVRDTGISIATISRFERGLSDITLAKLAPLLAAIHVTRKEFFFEYDFALAAAQKTPREAIHGVMADRDLPFDHDFLHQSEYSTQTVADILPVIAKRAAAFQENATQYNLLMLAYYRAMYGFLKHTPDTHSIDILRHYLLNVDDWGVFEIELFIGSSMFYAPADNLQMLRTGYRKSQRLGISREFGPLQYWLLASDFTVLLALHDLPRAGEVLTMLQSQKSDGILTGQVETMFFSGWLMIARGHMDAGERICRSAIAIFHVLHDQQSEQNWTTKLENILQDPTAGYILLSGGLG